MQLPPSKVFTVKEAAAYFKVHQSTIYRMLKYRQLPAFKVGSDWRFNIEELDAWRLSRKTATTPDGEKP